MVGELYPRDSVQDTRYTKHWAGPTACLNVSVTTEQMVTISIRNNCNYTDTCSNNNVNYRVNMFVVNNVLETEHNLQTC
jgi:hypothetical protein